jgi:hypothetical protein
MNCPRLPVSLSRPGALSAPILLALLGASFVGGASARAQPYAADDWAYTGFYQPVQIYVLENDDAYPASIEYSSVLIISQPLGGELSVDPYSGEVSYAPYDWFYGSDSFSYVYRDSLGEWSNEARVDLWVESPIPPYANDDYASGDFSGPLLIDVAGNDVGYEAGIDYSTVVIEYTPLIGAVQVLTSGLIEYTPNPSATSDVDYFMYSVKDELGFVSNSGFVTVQLNNSTPDISLNATDLGEGYWRVSGHVSDDQLTPGLDVELTGAMSSWVTVDAAGNFSFTDYIGPNGGCVWACVTDRIGATSPYMSVDVGD